jgi:hypothetical protein
MLTFPILFLMQYTLQILQMFDYISVIMTLHLYILEKEKKEEGKSKQLNQVFLRKHVNYIFKVYL